MVLTILYPLSSIPFLVEIITALLTLSGMAYSVIALFGARDFQRTSRRTATTFTPAGSILKPVKGVDSRMYLGFVSHCLQQYPGDFEIVFGVSSLADDAVAQIARLRVEYPAIPIKLVECPQRLGTNGKISNLAQMLPHATHDFIVVNDSDILVSPSYLTSVMAPFADTTTGLVTVPYVGRSEGSLWARIEALGISTDFMPGVLTARKLEGGIRFGLGSTLATSKSA